MTLGPPSSPAPGFRVASVRGAGHAAALARLHAGAFVRPWIEAEFAALLAQTSTRAHGLLVGLELVGFAVSQLVGDEAEVLTVVVGPTMRGRGHARPLFARHLEDLATEGARVVHLEVEDGDGPALALYRRAGFREVGRRRGYYAKADEAPAEAIRMSLEDLGEALAAVSKAVAQGRDARPSTV
jgi:ribosomal-protein-alanine N-acetyltransferase